MDVDTKLDMVKDPTSGTDNYISQFVFESCEMRHEKREKRYFSIIVLLIVLLVATSVQRIKVITYKAEEQLFKHI